MPQDDPTILEEAKSLLVQGRRCMALEDYQSATDFLEHSCQLFDAFYGVAKRECADAYLEYGLALVALANLEAGTGTDKLIKKAGIEDEDEEDDDYEDDEEQENEEEDEEENADDEEDEVQETAKKLTEDEKKVVNGDSSSENNNKMEVETKTNGHVEESKINGVADKSRKATEQNQPQASSSRISTAQEPTPGTSDGCTLGGDAVDKESESVENEEATTIEIAWEVLCLAKRLYMTDESLEGRLKLAETLQKIGEISIEWDNNDNAVSILEECLKIRSAILSPEDRLIALTYYHLGLAHSFKSDTQNANENFQNAINVIEKRIAALSEDLEKAKASQDTVAIGSYQKEINELKELLPDMTMRIDDSKEDSIKSTEVLKRTREEMQLEDEEAKKVCSDKSKPVDDISHLVKRKAA